MVNEDGPWLPQTHGGLRFWPPIHISHPYYPSVEHELLDKALVSKYSDCTLAEPQQHEVDTSEAFPSERCPIGAYTVPGWPHPNRQLLYEYIHGEFKNDGAVANAQVLLIITDTDNLENTPHWQYTSRLIRERCALTTTENKELWTPVFVPLNYDAGLEQIHYTWGGVFVLEAFAMLFPYKTYIMWDHDAAPTSLWETAGLVSM